MSFVIYDGLCRYSESIRKFFLRQCPSNFFYSIPNRRHDRLEFVYVV